MRIGSCTKNSERNSFFILAATLALVPLFPFPCLAQTISGAVYQSDGATPFAESIYIEAISAGDPCSDSDIAGAALTNSADGTYTIIGLVAGTYYLRTSFSDMDYVNEWWADGQSVSNCEDAQSLTLNAGESLRGKDFQLDAGARISGTVYQSDGTTRLGEDDMVVEAVSDTACGESVAAWAYADASHGTYTLMGLAPGSYYLRTALSESNYVNEWWAASASTSDCADAEALSVESAETLSGKNFQLDAGATVSGTIYEKDGTNPLDGYHIYIDAVSGDPCGDWKPVRFAYSDSSDGTYEIAGLAPGSYYLRTSILGPDYVDEWWAESTSVADCEHAESFAVEAQGVLTGKDFQLASEGSISGTVYENDGTTPVSESGIEIRILSGDACDGEASRSAFVDASDGSYEIANVPPGSYFFQASASESGHLDAWMDGSESVLLCGQARQFVLMPGEALTGRDFRLTPQASVSGTVYQTDGVRAFTKEAVSVRAVSGDPCDGTVAASAESGLSDGTFRISGMPPGSYWLRTLISGDSPEDEWWAEDASVPDCQDASSFTLDAGASLSGKNFQLATIPKGDADGDDDTDLADAILILQMLAGSPSKKIWLDADGDGDGKVGMAEAAYVLRAIGSRIDKSGGSGLPTRTERDVLD